MIHVRIDPSRERTILDFRPLGFRDVVVLGRYRYRQVHHPLQAHSHGDMFEICLLDQGRQIYLVQDHSFLLRGGDAFFTRPHEVHGTGCYPEDRGTLYWMLLRVPRKTEPFLLLPPEQHQCLFHQLNQLPARVFPTQGRLKPILDRVFDLFADAANPLRVPALQNWILRFLLDFVELGRQPPANPNRRALSRACRRAQDYITHHLQQRIKVDSLAKAAGLSPSRFKMRFKAEIGMSPSEYAMRRKIDVAQQSLANSSAKIIDIALDLGFSSSQHFATVFRRYTGLTPGRFRRENTASPKNRKLFLHQP